MNYFVTEDQADVNITVRVLEGQVGTVLTFDVVILPENMSATEGDDFILLTREATIGYEAIQTTVGFEIIDDSAFEGMESFTIELSNCCDQYDQLVSLEPSLATIHIVDNGKTSLHSDVQWNL